ncbi:hypothetical protein, variant [Fonticula alba]|uniref:RNA helicase n=1 Tax=Fonticula alba TaxID=691883 RepID=A0A058ZEV0_FONAL|nr:hypothetical protein H696_00473 [Fonticula alba]XP_009492605.1 hypothetical protein, variant [Fonticula alba]KCV72903.1 hypothetical protein H696_00473 [Fonticula alba]KCV72904.1 hypothetical protein, variant [Fonticula alba]|eukprot:XP_009492604.1 hypothetical protein H696_00473 [Fonticula alba]
MPPARRLSAFGSDSDDDDSDHHAGAGDTLFGLDAGASGPPADAANAGDAEADVPEEDPLDAFMRQNEAALTSSKPPPLPPRRGRSLLDSDTDGEGGPPEGGDPQSTNVRSDANNSEEEEDPLDAFMKANDANLASAFSNTRGTLMDDLSVRGGSGGPGPAAKKRRTGSHADQANDFLQDDSELERELAAERGALRRADNVDRLCDIESPEDLPTGGPPGPGKRDVLPLPPPPDFSRFAFSPLVRRLLPEGHATLRQAADASTGADAAAGPGTGPIPSRRTFFQAAVEAAGAMCHMRTAVSRGQTPDIEAGRLPMPITRFAEVLPGALGQELDRRFPAPGGPSPVQAVTIPCALTGRDVVALAQTGSGKTIAYLAPAVAHCLANPLGPASAKGTGAGPPPGGDDSDSDSEDTTLAFSEAAANTGRTSHPRCIILVPTRELVIQIQAEAARLAGTMGLHSVAIYGGAEKLAQLRTLRRLRPALVVATPGRLIDMVRMKALGLAHVSLIVLDEADRMLDLGFEPQVRSVCQHARPDRQMLLLSATAGGRHVARLVRDLVGADAVHVAVSATGADGAAGALAAPSTDGLFLDLNADAPETDRMALSTSDIKHSVACFDSDLAKFDYFLHTLMPFLMSEASSLDLYAMQQRQPQQAPLDQSQPPGVDFDPRVIVFGSRVGIVNTIHRSLADAGYASMPLHGDLMQGERERAIRAFRLRSASGTLAPCRVLVATDVAARGLDIPGVTAVVSFDAPGGGAGTAAAVDAFVHRVGRTGRAGRAGRAISLLIPSREGRFATELARWFQAHNSPSDGGASGTPEPAVPEALLPFLNAGADGPRRRGLGYRERGGRGGGRGRGGDFHRGGGGGGHHHHSGHGNTNSYSHGGHGNSNDYHRGGGGASGGHPSHGGPAHRPQHNNHYRDGRAGGGPPGRW